jgi:hypothetical protein
MSSHVSRRALFSIIPAGAAGCLGCARAVCAQAPPPSSAHNWTEKADITCLVCQQKAGRHEHLIDVRTGRHLQQRPDLRCPRRHDVQSAMAILACPVVQDAGPRLKLYGMGYPPTPVRERCRAERPR